jgi:hypothetical protein
LCVLFNVTKLTLVGWQYPPPPPCVILKSLVSVMSRFNGCLSGMLRCEWIDGILTYAVYAPFGMAAITTLRPSVLQHWLQGELAQAPTRSSWTDAVLPKLRYMTFMPTPDTDATTEMCSSHQGVHIYIILTYFMLTNRFNFVFSTYVGSFDSKFTSYIMLFHQYWLYKDTTLYDNGITLQLRPFTVIAGSSALDTISECGEPGSVCLMSILNFYSHYTKKALDMFSFASQTRVTSNKQLVHWTSRFHKINAPMGSEHVR